MIGKYIVKLIDKLRSIGMTDSQILDIVKYVSSPDHDGTYWAKDDNE